MDMKEILSRPKDQDIVFEGEDVQRFIEMSEPMLASAGVSPEKLQQNKAAKRITGKHSAGGGIDWQYEF